VLLLATLRQSFAASNCFRRTLGCRIVLTFLDVLLGMLVRDSSMIMRMKIRLETYSNRNDED
jgi:hypothetical protein